MSCIPGNQYNYDSSLYRYTCSGESLVPIYLSTVNSGQILTFRSGQSAWFNNNKDIYEFGPSGLVWSLESGSNLYSFNLGLKPFEIGFIPGSGLPIGLTLVDYNKITGIPTETGIFKCATRYVYCSGQPHTGTPKQFTIIVCTGSDAPFEFKPNFLPKIGAQFFYDNFRIIPPCSTGISNGVEIISILTGQRLTLEVGQPAWVYNGPTYEFQSGDRFFALINNSNLYTNNSGIEPFQFEHTDMPPNLGFSKYNLITGTPLSTGFWSINVTQKYCSGLLVPFTRTSRISLEILSSEALRPNEGILYSTYSSANSIPYIERKVKNLDFYYRQNNRFNRYFDTVTGYGNLNLDISGQNILVFDSIFNPTGWREALIYQTGRLTGIIGRQESSFTWPDESITGQLPYTSVFINEVTGTRQSRNIIYVNTGLLIDGDVLNINGFNFTYSTIETTDNFIFNNLNQLVSKLNSGALDPFSNLGLVGVTGFVENDNLYLYSYLLNGESGNSIRVYRDTEILESIIIPNRYFVSGETLRPTTNTWRGVFNSIYTINAENSGVYNYTAVNPDFFQDISGVIWEDTFSGNYFITTGIQRPDNITEYSGTLLNYIPNKNIYSGSAIIPSGQNRVPNTFNIDILKRNYYNISGNFANYKISGLDFLFTGIIEG